MARYTASVCKLCRRVSGKLMLKGSRCFTPKCAMEKRRRIYVIDTALRPFVGEDKDITVLFEDLNGNDYYENREHF